MESAFPQLDMRNCTIKVNSPGITYSLKDYDAPETLPGTDGKIISINMEHNYSREGALYCSPNYCMSLTFNNAYKVGNSWVDVTIDIRWVKSTYKHIVTWDLPFLCIPNNADLCPRADSFPWIYGYSTDTEVALDIGMCYHGTDKYLTGSNFYLGVGDLDVKYDSQIRYPESVWLREGFTGDIYLWDGNFLDIETNPAWDYPWFKATDKKVDAGIDVEGDNSWYYGGFIAPLSYGGWCKADYYCEGCGTYVILGCDFGSMDPPKKTVENKDYYDGDSIKWNIKADLYEFYFEGFSKLTSLIIEDELQSGQRYVSSRILQDGVDVSNKFNITYDTSTRVLKATAKSEHLAQESFYNGKPFNMEINCIIESANVKSDGILENEGKVIYDGEPSTTTTEVPVKYKLTTSYEGQGTISDEVLNIPAGGSCSATYAPAENWCLQKLVIDNETEITGDDILDYLSKYEFTDVHKNHHVHAVFVPNYKITVEKKVDKSMDVFGSPYFEFQISGTDVYGKSHTWYRQIKGNGSTTWVVPMGTYTVTELPVERYTVSKIIGKQNCDSNGVCTVLTGNAHVIFENTFDDYKDYGHNDSNTNKLK